MKQLISTKLFLALQETSQIGIDGDVHVLKDGYEELVMHLLSHSAEHSDKVAFYNKLVYTSIELGCLSLVAAQGRKEQLFSARFFVRNLR